MPRDAHSVWRRYCTGSDCYKTSFAITSLACVVAVCVALLLTHQTWLSLVAAPLQTQDEQERPLKELTSDGPDGVRFMLATCAHTTCHSMWASKEQRSRASPNELHCDGKFSDIHRSAREEGGGKKFQSEKKNR